MWNDRHRDVLLAKSPKDDLSGKPGAEATVTRKGQLGETFEDTALARRLIAHYDKLRKVYVLTNTAGKELIDLFQQNWVTKTFFLPFFNLHFD